MRSPLDPFRQALARAAVETFGLPPESADALDRQIRVPEREHGDLSLACFELAKQKKGNPKALAEELAQRLSEGGEWAEAQAVGPYVNVRLSPAQLAQAVVPAARAPGFGDSEEGKGKTVVIDFSSPNIAKPLAFHHVRSTVIGAAIGRLHAAQGWKVVGINYLGDWGKQFGLLATGFRRYGDPTKRADAKHLVEVYVKANRDADVEGRKATIEGPDRAKALVAELEALRAQAAAAEDKDKKKLEKKAKGLEKKILGERGLSEQEDPFTRLDDWYKALNEKADDARRELPEAEERDREARLFFKKLEEGEADAVREWQEFRETSIAEFQRVYARMGIEFSSIEGESFYTKVLEATVDRVTEKPGTEISEGALIAKLEYDKGEPPVLLRTRDGTTLYVTRDIAAAIDRHERYQFDRSLYVVAQDQALHFRQLFKTLAAMGFDWAGNMQHVAFGRVHGMSTRRGNIVFLDEVLDESVGKAREICTASDRIDQSHLDDTVEAIGVGAVVFGDLKNLRASDYTFRWEDILNFEGHTGPYAQFAHARACSILAKGGGAPAEADLSLLTLDEERNVLLALAAFPVAVAEACEAFEPSIVTRALLEVAQSTSSWLTSGNKDRDKRVLTDDQPAVTAARLQLVDAVRNTLAAALGLLGVNTPESM